MLTPFIYAFLIWFALVMVRVAFTAAAPRPAPPAHKTSRRQPPEPEPEPLDEREVFKILDETVKAEFSSRRYSVRHPFDWN